MLHGVSGSALIRLYGSADMRDPAGEGVLRRAVEMEGGVLVVYGAATPVGMTRARGAYLAWWRDYADNGLYLYSELMYAENDVGEAMRALERDLGVLPGALETPLNPPLERGAAETRTPLSPLAKGGGYWRGSRQAGC